VAEHFSLDTLIGGIAPGRLADMVMIPDMKTIDARLVISNGKVIATEGRPAAAPREHTFTKESLNSVNLVENFNPSDFIITAEDDTGTKKLRIINMVTDLVTAELEMEWPVTDGEIKSNVTQDVIKVAAIDRTHNPGKMTVGLINGFGLKSGAMACSAGWDSSDIIVVGTNDADMADAVNRIHALQGAAIVCENGKILVELPLPIFGIMSQLPIETIAQRLREIKKAVADRGVPFPDPLLSLITLTGAAIPYLRICEEGLVNLKTGKIIGLFLD
jgi:adenine deaminase